jgi:WD40 repeat protein
LWFDGKITCSKTFYSLQGGVTSLITTSDELYAGTYDGSIQRFDIKSGDLQQSVDAHTQSVWSLAIDQQYNLIYSTGSDETIKVWDRELNEICSLESNQGKIYRLLLDNNILFSASSKGVVKIWDTISRECIGQMLGHTGGVNSMKRYRDKLITASSDKTIKVTEY